MKIIKLLSKIALTFILIVISIILIKHGSSAAFDLAMFLGFMAFFHWLFWS